MPADVVHTTQIHSFEIEDVPHASENPFGYVKPSLTRSRTSSVSNTTSSQQKAMSIRKRPSLPSLTLPFLSRRSSSETVTHFRSPSSAGTPSFDVPIYETDNSDLLADDPFAADTTRFSSNYTINSASFGPNASTPSTPSLYGSSSTRSSRDSDLLEDEVCLNSDEEEIKVEPLHRLPPPISPRNSIRRKRSRPSLAGRPSLPCLSELETRPLSQYAYPAPKCMVAKAKAKAGKLPVEPWDNLPDPVYGTTDIPPPLPPKIRPPSQVGVSRVAEEEWGRESLCHKKQEPAYADIAVALGAAAPAAENATCISTTISAASAMPSADHSHGQQPSGKYYGYSNNSNSHSTTLAEAFKEPVKQLSYSHDDRDIEEERRRKRDAKWGTGFELKSAWSDESDEEEETREIGHSSTPSTSSSSSSDDSSPQKVLPWAGEEDEEDDVPLAKQIPTALSAQKSIRANLREERHRKRAEKLANLRAKHQQDDITKENPIEDAKKAEILVNKLLEVQSRVHGISLPDPSTPEDSSLSRKSRSGNPSAPTTPKVNYSPLARSSTTVTPRLRPARSRSQIRPANWDALQGTPPPMPSTSRISEPGFAHERNTVAVVGSGSPSPGSTVRRANSVGSRRRTHSAEERAPPPVPPLPAVLQEYKAPLAEARIPSRTFHPMRIFINDAARYVTVDLEETTTAGDVVEIVRARGELKDASVTGEDINGDWMLWELDNEFGMERPIRSFERPLDVTASWSLEKRLNALVIKRTSLAHALKRNVIPGVAPQYGGYVEWESRKGKWNRRWLELRESSLFLSKKEHAPDEVFLCSLSNFDAYAVSPRHRTPKKYAFAVRSADNSALFENPADYVHIFSCDPKPGNDWLQRLLVGRSFVMQQEKAVLFRGRSSNEHGSSSGSGQQRRQAPAAPLVEIKVLPNTPSTVSSFAARSAPSNKTTYGPFEPGSLLAKQFNASL